MTHRFETNPGLAPEEMTEAIRDLDTAEALEWAQDPDRWTRIGEDPVEEINLQDEFDQSYPQKSLEHPVILQAQLSPVQLVLLKRAWMVQVTDRTRLMTDPMAPEKTKLARIVEMVRQA